MLLKKWEELPEFIKNNEVKRYYDALAKKRCSLALKRVFDVIMSLILLVVLSPLFLAIAVWIRLDSEGSVFYRQNRVTQYGREFKIFKFRTMVENADKTGTSVTVQNDSRITKVGEKIRKCRLDEIPQLLNILVGDMSFVGTRPEVKKYVNVYSDEMLATLLLPAGVTSLASLRYRDEDEIISKYVGQGYSVDQAYIEKVMPQKMEYNLEYIKTFSIGVDIGLCLKTVL